MLSDQGSLDMPGLKSSPGAVESSHEYPWVNDSKEIIIIFDIDSGFGEQKLSFLVKIFKGLFKVDEKLGKCSRIGLSERGLLDGFFRDLDNAETT